MILPTWAMLSCSWWYTPCLCGVLAIVWVLLCWIWNLLLGQQGDFVPTGLLRLVLIAWQKGNKLGELLYCLHPVPLVKANFKGFGLKCGEIDASIQWEKLQITLQNMHWYRKGWRITGILAILPWWSCWKNNSYLVFKISLTTFVQVCLDCQPQPFLHRPE